MKTVKKRRQQAKTNYSTRLKLLKSDRPRLVFRKTNKLVIAQYITSEEAKDKVVFGVTSKVLMKHGWSGAGSLKSVPASYLTGYFVAKKILRDKLETPIVDLGMLRTLAKTRIFGFIKGMIDGGVEIPCKEENFPEENRINGEILKNKVDINAIKSNIDKN